MSLTYSQFNCRGLFSGPFKRRYRFGAEFGGEYVAYGGDEVHVELLAQAQEVAEGQDDHLFGMSVQPLSHLQENRLPGETQVTC